MNRRTVISFAAGALLATSGAIGLAAQQQAPAKAEPRPEVATTHLKVGDAAPDFTLPGTDGNRFTLSEYRGKKNVILAFYVLAFTGG